MERVCALPSYVVHQVVELDLQLLQCPQDQARKNFAIFFAAAFVFKAVLDAFDAKDGLEKVLNLLHGAASVRSGGNSGTLGMSNSGLLRNGRSPSEVLTASEKQVAYHTCVALRQYFRAPFCCLWIPFVQIKLIEAWPEIFQVQEQLISLLTSVMRPWMQYLFNYSVTENSALHL